MPAQPPPDAASPAGAPHDVVPPAPGAAHPAPGLRERRRQETTSQIHAAAVELTEQQGLDAVTVAAIAAAAGVSSRTFFRYFPSKEAAIVPGQGLLARRLDALAEDAKATPATAGEPAAVGRLTSLLGTLIKEEPIDAHEHRRIGALLEREPALRAHVSSEDTELIRKSVEVLTLWAPGFDPDEARLHAELAFSAWRVAWWSWDRLGPSLAYPTPHSRWLWAVSRCVPAAALVAADPGPTG